MRSCLRFPQCSAQMSGSLLFPPWTVLAAFVCRLWTTAPLSSTRRFLMEQMGRECVSRGCNLSDTEVIMTYGATGVIVLSVRLASWPCRAARQIQRVGMVRDREKPERERKATNTHTHTLKDSRRKTDMNPASVGASHYGSSLFISSVTLWAFFIHVNHFYIGLSLFRTVMYEFILKIGKKHSQSDHQSRVIQTFCKMKQRWTGNLAQLQTSARSFRDILGATLWWLNCSVCLQSVWPRS